MPLDWTLIAEIYRKTEIPHPCTKIQLAACD